MTYFGSDSGRPDGSADRAPAPFVPWGNNTAASPFTPARADDAPAAERTVAPSFDSAATPAAFSVVHPPLLWAALALAAGLVGIVLAGVWGEVGPLAAVAWVIGGPACFSLASVFVSIDTSRRTQVGYSRGTPDLATALYVAAIVSGIVAVLVAAIRLAFWAGRGF